MNTRQNLEREYQLYLHYIYKLYLHYLHYFYKLFLIKFTDYVPLSLQGVCSGF